MKVIIAEKPSVGRTYAEVLGATNARDGYMEGNGWIVTWAIGHLVTMAYPEKYAEELKRWSLGTLPFLPTDYIYEVIPDVRKQFNIVRELYNREDVSEIYLAGDSGREGLYIQVLILNEAGCNPNADIKVVWISSQTEDEIKKGIEKAKPLASTIYQNMKAAGYARAKEDYSVGINFSRLLTLLYGDIANAAVGYSGKDRKTISVGRVMTCVLGMIVDREASITHFKPEKFYKICSTIDGSNIDCEWKAEESSDYIDHPKLYKNIAFLEENVAKELIAKLPGEVLIEDIKIANEKKYAPVLFNLAEFQNACAKKLKVSPDKALEIAQSLYEKKLTTYPRTDAKVLSKAVVGEIEKNLEGIRNIPAYNSFADEILQSNYKEIILDKRFCDDSKITDHYAIIPTGYSEGLNRLSGHEAKAYEMIMRRFLAIFYPPAVYEKVTLVEKAGNEYFYTAKKRLIHPGWLVTTGEEIDKVTGKFNVEKGKKYPSVYSIKEGETKPPARYNSGSIILAMEAAGKLIEDEELRAQLKTCGIGTAATRAEIIKKLIKLQYISLDQKTQIITPAFLGCIIYTIVKNTIPELLSPEMTAEWESGLNSIGNGDLSEQEYMEKMISYIRGNVERLKNGIDKNRVIKEIKQLIGKNNDLEEELKHFERIETDMACPKCGRPLVTNKWGWGCKGHKKDDPDSCDFFVGTKKLNVQITEAMLRDMLKGKATKLFEFHNPETGKSFKATLVIGDVKKKNGEITKGVTYDFPSEQTDFTCPDCGKLLNKTTFGWVCSGYDGQDPTSCRFVVRNAIAGASLKEKDFEDLVTNGITSRVIRFKAKSGKPFNAMLAFELDEGKHKIVFKFPDEDTEIVTEYECPNCGNKLIRTKWNYECSCGYRLNQYVAKKLLSDNEIKQLIRDGRTKNPVTKLKGRKGDFEAFLIADSSGSISFEFPKNETKKSSRNIRRKV